MVEAVKETDPSAFINVVRTEQLQVKFYHKPQEYRSWYPSWRLTERTYRRIPQQLEERKERAKHEGPDRINIIDIGRRITK